MRKLLFLLLLGGAAAADAVTLCDFIGERLPVPVWQGRTLEQSATYEPGGLRVRWNTARNGTCIFGEPWKKTEPLGEFRKADCHVELELPEHVALTSFRVRFIDSQKEVFQWGTVADFRKPGIVRLTIPMTQTNFPGAFR